MDELWPYIVLMSPLLAGLAVSQSMERAAPWRRAPNADAFGWLQVAVLFLAGVLLARILLPITQTAAALWAGDAGFGLLHMIDAPLWVSILAALIVLDFWDFVRHWALHRWSALWRIHRLHHAPTHIDVSVAFRFHPFEAVVTAVGSLAVVALIGAPPETIILHLVIGAAVNLWGHANFRWPEPLLRRVAYVFITPDLHRVHHGVSPDQMGANFGFVLSVWDRMFGTLATPRAEDRIAETLEFGLGDGGRLSFAKLADLFVDPFRSAKD